MVIIFSLSVISSILCFVTTAKAQENAIFNHIICRSLTIVDEIDSKRISLRANRDTALFNMIAGVVGFEMTGRVTTLNIINGSFDIGLITTGDGAGLNVTDKRVTPTRSASFMNATKESAEIGVLNSR